jgi:hypothetical protein
VTVLTLWSALQEDQSMMRMDMGLTDLVMYQARLSLEQPQQKAKDHLRRGQIIRSELPKYFRKIYEPIFEFLSFIGSSRHSEVALILEFGFKLKRE